VEDLLRLGLGEVVDSLEDRDFPEHHTIQFQAVHRIHHALASDDESRCIQEPEDIDILRKRRPRKTKYLVTVHAFGLVEGEAYRR